MLWRRDSQAHWGRSIASRRVYRRFGIDWLYLLLVIFRSVSKVGHTGPAVSMVAIPKRKMMAAKWAELGRGRNVRIGGIGREDILVEAVGCRTKHLRWS